jgi:hypothetical protein
MVNYNSGGITPPAGDIGGTASSPTVTGTHLAAPLPVAQGGTGQAAAAAAYNALSPMTTTGDMEYDSGAAVAARLPVGGAGQVLGVAGGVPAWGAGMTLLASTGAGGYALVNGTGTVITWTAPNDGQVHRFAVLSTIDVATTETGGQINVTYTVPNGNSASNGLYTAGLAAGHNNLAAGTFLKSVAPGSTVSVTQSSALTGGASTLWAEIWGS